jgi:hypothetical protein
MSEIHESLTVICPFDQVPAAAAAYVSSLPIEDGLPTVALRVKAGDVIVERRADLVLKHVRSLAGYEIMEIKWRPHDGGLYPIFRGTLSVEDVTGNYCRIDLDGSYVPPLGVAGAVFDSVLGHRIAVAAARELLDEIKIGFELAFQSSRVLHTVFSRRR